MAGKKHRQGGNESTGASAASSGPAKVQDQGLDMSAMRELMADTGAHEAMDEQAVAQLTGQFVVQGNWDSFSEWNLQFLGGQLVSSYTDDLGAAEWPTTAVRSGREIALTQKTEGGDATLIEELVIEVTHDSDGPTFRVKRATSTFVDHTSEGERSTTTQTGLAVHRA